MRAREGRAARLLGGNEFHELDTGFIRIEEIELHFAVESHLSLAAVGAFAVVARQRGNGVLHVGYAE